MSDSTDDIGKARGSKVKWALGGFAVVGAFLLLAEHRAHVLPWLPWLLLLACPLMHAFMHGGGHRSHDDRHCGANRSGGGDEGLDGTRSAGPLRGGTAPREDSQLQERGPS